MEEKYSVQLLKFLEELRRFLYIWNNYNWSLLIEKEEKELLKSDDELIALLDTIDIAQLVRSVVMGCYKLDSEKVCQTLMAGDAAKVKEIIKKYDEAKNIAESLRYKLFYTRLCALSQPRYPSLR